MTFKPDEQENVDAGNALNQIPGIGGLTNTPQVEDLVGTLTNPITEATGDILEVTQELLNSIANTMVSKEILILPAAYDPQLYERVVKDTLG